MMASFFLFCCCRFFLLLAAFANCSSASETESSGYALRMATTDTDAKAKPPKLSLLRNRSMAAHEKSMTDLRNVLRGACRKNSGVEMASDTPTKTKSS